MHESRRWRTYQGVTAAALVTGIALFLASAGFTLWQNTRVAVLWDLTYLLDDAWRFSLGQLPYRDLPFAHAPLTFLLHTAIVKVCGRVYYPHVVCAAVESGLGTILTWRILLRLNLPRWQAAALAAPLVVLGIYSIYPHPIYDGDAALTILVALYLLQRGEARPARALCFCAGAACVLPIFFKQNIGLAFLGATFGYTAISAVLARRSGSRLAPQLWTAAGMASALALGACIVQYTVGLPHYLYWTVGFAAQRRLPGLRVLLSAYHQPSLLWSLPAAATAVMLLRSTDTRRVLRMTAFVLLASPFLWTVISFVIEPDADDRADQLLSLWPHLLILGAALALANLRPSVFRKQPLFRAFLPMILLVTIHGTFLSQQLWGSTYAIWPLLVLLLPGLLETVEEVKQPLMLVISATLLVCGGVYATSLERLSYIHLDGPVAHATLPALHRMATPGSFLPEFEGLVHFADTEIPAKDGILIIPGEVPFYFATGRTPQFPILLFDPATDPYAPQQTLQEAHRHGIQWVMVGRHLQLNADPHPDLPQITSAVLTDYALYRHLPGYDVYRRK